jgi:hypothetical protein
MKYIILLSQPSKKKSNSRNGKTWKLELIEIILMEESVWRSGART